MPLDCKLSPDGVGILQRGEERGTMGLTTVDGVPLLLARPGEEEITLLWWALCLIAGSEALAPRDLHSDRVRTHKTSNQN